MVQITSDYESVVDLASHNRTVLGTNLHIQEEKSISNKSLFATW